MIVIAGHFRVPGGVSADFEPHVKAYVAAVNREPGCRHFSFAYDAVDPEIIRAFEIYDDRAAFDAHGKSAHLIEWKAARGRFGVTDRVMNLYAVEAVEAV